MRKILLVCLILTLGGGIGGCWITDKVGDGVKNYVINLSEEKLNGLSEEKYQELKAYLSLKDMDIKDLDKDLDGLITVKELNALPGMLIMNPKTATDWKFWELLLFAVLPTYGHRTIRKFLGGKPNGSTSKA